MIKFKLRLSVLLLGLALSGLSRAALMNLDPLPGVTFPGGSGQSEFGRLLGLPSGGWTNGAAGRTVYVGSTILEHPAQAIKVPVMLRAGAGTALNLARGAFFHPAVIAAVGAYGIYSWFTAEGLQVVDNKWVKPEEGTCTAYCYEYKGAGNIWYKSVNVAAQTLTGPHGCTGTSIYEKLISASGGAQASYTYTLAYCNGDPLPRPNYTNPIPSRSIDTPMVEMVPVPQSDFENLLKNKMVSPEILNGWPSAAIPVIIPVDLPVINPDSSERPSTKTEPIGPPVASNPQTNPPTWKSPIIDVKPWNDPDKPWQVDVKPGDFVKTNPYPLPDPDKPPWDETDPNNPKNNPNPNPLPWLDPTKPPWNPADPDNPDNQPNPNPYPLPSPNPNPNPLPLPSPNPNPNPSPDPVPNNPTDPDPNTKVEPQPDPNTGTQPKPKGLCDEYPNIPACKAPVPTRDFCELHPNASACKPFSQFCVENPGILACAKLDDVPPAEKLPTRDVPVTVEPVPFVNQASCPAPLSFQAFGKTYDVSYQPLCDQMSIMRALILAIAGVLAAYILADSFRVT